MGFTVSWDQIREGMATKAISVQGSQLSPPRSVQVQFCIAPNATSLLAYSRGVPPHRPHTHPHCVQGCGCGDNQRKLMVSSATSGSRPGPPDVEKHQQKGGQEHPLWQQHGLGSA